VSLLGTALAAAAFADGVWVAAALLGVGGLAVPGIAIREAGRAQGQILEAVGSLSPPPPDEAAAARGGA
jgi:hypothetical protein